MNTNNEIVYQVRSVDAWGRQNVVHAYETEAAAKTAIKFMYRRTRKRYVIHAVKNRPNQHWGINFPETPAPKPSRRGPIPQPPKPQRQID